jgi:hypothetical protein
MTEPSTSKISDAFSQLAIKKKAMSPGKKKAVRQD